MTDKDKLVGFITLSNQDCIDDPSRSPWLGFLYVHPEYRGNQLSQALITHAVDVARRHGFEQVFLATDHTGLYEKYGFTYLGNQLDIWGENSGIYSRPTEHNHSVAQTEHIKVHIANTTRDALCEQLKANSVFLNHHALRLLDHTSFEQIACADFNLSILTAREIGIGQKANLKTIYTAADNYDLQLIPLQYAPLVRLQSTWQTMSHSDILTGLHQSPEGAIPIASPIASSDDDYPKGFYIRNVAG